ncbi:hypothetical protein ACO0K7_02205 [Undibacterium sp. Ji67W]|uniref:hypothetical protein n=1 Tax=Undibacterium sp. Ji67W TaxID=3413042 RepID=UPI003BF0A1C4
MNHKQSGIFSIVSNYWSVLSSRLQVASWAHVLGACFMVLIAGIVLHLTTLAKLIVTIFILNKIFLRRHTEKKATLMLGSAHLNQFYGEVK